MSRKTIVRHPDGTTSTRTSKNRVYSHAVVVERTRESMIADAQTDFDRAADRVKAAFSLSVSLTPEAVQEERKPWAFGGEYVTLSAFGTYLTAYVSEKDEAPSFESLKALVEERMAQAVEFEARLEEVLREVKAGTGSQFNVVRWSSREDLATKAATGEFASSRSNVHVSVVECEEG